MSSQAGVRGAVVIGVSRSGTSVTTSLLVAAGFHAGRRSELMAADPSQPAGYFEHSRLFHLHEQILAELGSTWLSPPSDAAAKAARARYLPRLRRMLDLLQVRAGNRPIVVKDPRISGLLGLWEELIDDRLHPVLAIRDPVEVALSTWRRDGTPCAFGTAGWELHTRRTLAFLDGRRVTISPFAQLQRDPEVVRTVVTDTVAQIGPEWREELDAEAATSVVQPQLHRNQAAGRDHALYLTLAQSELWEYLRALAPGTQVLKVPSDLLNRSEAVASALTEAEAARVRANSQITALRAEVARLSAHADQHQAALLSAEAERAAQVAQLHAEAARLRHRSELHERFLTDISGSVSWRLTQPLRSAKSVWRRRPSPMVASRG